jgi:hypothetical protein
MKKNIKPISIVVTFLITAFLFVVLVFPAFKTQAADLTDVFLYLSRIEDGLDGTGDNTVEMILVFTPTGDFSTGGTIEISFPPGAANADIGAWCRTEGALTVAGVTSSPADSALYTSLPGTLTADCDEGSGGSGDTITISGLTALTNSTTYGVKLSNDAGALGTSNSTGSKTVAVQVEQGSDLESMAFGVYIIDIDTVEVEATVSAAPTVECTLDTTKVTMPVLYPGGVISEETVDDQITTTAPSTGYYWAAYGEGDGSDAGLYNSAGGTDLIASSATTVDISAPNSEGFGINLDPDAGGTVPANFQTGTVGRYGGIVYGPDGARLILSKTSAATAETVNVIYGARAASDALAGTYTEFITYVCGGYY